MTEPTSQDPFAAPPQPGAAQQMPAQPYAQQPVPQAPYAYGQGGYVTPALGYVGQNPTEKNWMGITALALSLAALVAGILASIPAVVFGHLGLSAVKKGEANNRGLALAGVILGYIGIALTVLFVIAYIAFIGFAISSTSSDGMF
ncbi:DUF4190 domain-containing protein [Demequina zhanjiangensis]|uniref:DUF4190 domain-containing protein n=1 Tax=Demequina zhanjiangensis TaxID=3051659 RepID=A0ABT8G2K5_9MICO|nr:DUF4190 domain-containing protein [Demequina sp. SYSU T00b26]MDN4473307.1 DUF4190 domain-containing protein [Demequina sp. SYSU T00b26]